MTTIDDDLALLAAAGDGAAFDQLLHRHQAVIRGFLRRLAADEALADDLAQDTFLKVYQKIGSYRGPDRLRSWLLSVAYREFLAHRCREAGGGLLSWRMRWSDSDSEPGSMAIDAVDSDDGFAERLVDAMTLTQALDQLSGPAREAVLLSEVYGFTQTETATLMDKPVGTIKSHLLRGKRKLQALLDERNADQLAGNDPPRFEDEIQRGGTLR